ncbi:MAG: TonB-dependent receptor [Cyclobacteriaceae bacterium]|nr:TonB-dependent receptor [Cyclobacteriaceae bacterium]MCH8514971.1 TonB-dependent receptor [Cyclobacteriaceae bacterium]
MKRIFTLFMLHAVFLIGIASAQDTHPGSIFGKVVDEKGDAIIGASVRLMGTEKGAATDLNGQFQIRNIQPGNYKLSVTAVGMSNYLQDVNILAGDRQVNLSIELKEAQVYLEGLVVTSQKREQVIKEVPVAITSLSGDFFENLNIREVDQMAEFVPGLQIQLQSPNNPGFVVRGITSDDGDSRVEPRVSVFQDGVPISKSRGSVVEMFDMERVEVLKGPQGTLFGRGAQIGAVHFIQNKAKNHFSSELTMGVGNFGQQLVSGHVNTPIVKDKLAFRLAGQYNRRDGFIDNPVPGQDDLNGKGTIAIRPSLRWTPGNKTVVDFITNYQVDDYPGTAFASGTIVPRGQEGQPGREAAFGTVALDGQPAIPSGYSSPYNPNGIINENDRDRALGINRIVWGQTLIVDHEFNDQWSLTSTSAFRRFDSYESFDADGSAAPILWFAEESVGDQFTQEFRFNYNDNSRFAGFFGANYFWEKGSQRVPFMTDQRALAAQLSPLVADFAGLGFLTQSALNADGSAFLGINDAQGWNLVRLTQGIGRFGEFHEEQFQNFGNVSAYEIFADGSYKVTPDFSLTAGLRGTYEQVNNGFEAIYTGTTNPAGQLFGGITGAFPNVAFPPTNIQRNADGSPVFGADGNVLLTEDNNRREASGEFFSWVGRFIGDYKVSEQLNTYASISRGRRPNVIFLDANTENILNDEIVWSYEVGAKALTFNNRLQFDVSAYYYDYSNFQVTVRDDGAIPIIVDAGEATALGAETSFRYALNKNLSFFGNYAYIRARFDDTDADGNPQDFAGNRFRLTPDHSFSVGLDVRGKINNTTSYFFRPTYTWKSDVFFEEENQAGIEQAAFGLLNLRMGVSLLENRVELAIYGSNLLDEQFLIDAGNTGQNFLTPTFIAGPPRFFGFQVTGRFAKR